MWLIRKRYHLVRAAGRGYGDRVKRICKNCPVEMVRVEEPRDHPYSFDGRGDVRLIGLEQHRCRMCLYSEIAIPQIGPLHRTIAQAVKTLKVKREQLAFFFERGPIGVSDGTWGVVISTTTSAP